MKEKLVYSLLSILLIAGCSPATELPITPTSTLGNSPIATTIPTLIPSPIPSPTLLPTNTPESGFKTSCLEIADGEIPLQDVASGTIVLDKGGFPYQLFLLDLKLDKEYELPVQSKGTIYFGILTSPDRNSLAYVEGVKNTNGQYDRVILWIVNARAELLQKINFNLPALYSLRWLDNQSMIFETGEASKGGMVVFLNPFTREQHYVSNGMPNLYENQYNERIFWSVEYSPDLEWGVYLGRVQNGKQGFIVRDFTKELTVWETADPLGEYQQPIWSPNGNEVAVVAGGQLYLVNREGQAYPVAGENLKNQVSHSSWSPDGRYLVFWNFYKLTIYDGQLNQVIDLCVTNEYPDQFVWSPNSHQFVYGAYLDEGGVLVDLEKMVAHKLLDIPGTVYPGDWMNSIP